MQLLQVIAGGENYSNRLELSLDKQCNIIKSASSHSNVKCKLKQRINGK